MPGLMMLVLAGSAIVRQEVPPPPGVTLGGKTYHLIQGKALPVVLAGHMIYDPVCPNTAKCTDMFDANGHSFVQSGDRAPLLYGRYAVERYRYCMTLRTGYTHCKALYRADDGRYAETALGTKWSEPTAVLVKPYP